MSTLAVIVAGVASFMFGAIWYSLLAKPWMEASGVVLNEDGAPANRSNPLPYITAILASIIVAGMMRHVFVLGGIDTVAKGLVAGAGIGLFLAAPWIATNYGFAGRPMRLTLIDGGYAAIGCTVIGVVLTLF
ncbi:MAG: DUF1761 domain-containing protein [Pseudomonadota bacterium]